MRLMPKSITVAKFSTAFSELDKVISTIFGAGFVAIALILFTLVMVVAGVDIVITMPYIILMICAFPVSTTVIYCLAKLIQRKHSTRSVNGKHVPPKLYAYITDELRLRGITDAKQHLQEHPQYLHLCLELGDDLHTHMENTYAPSPAVEAIQALMFSIDEQHNEPQRIKDAITMLVIERHVTDISIIRDMIPALVNSESAISSGAL